MLTPPRDARMEQVRGWMSPLNTYVAGAVMLALSVLWLVVQLVLVGLGGTARGDDAIAAARTQQMASELAARPLRGVGWEAGAVAGAGVALLPAAAAVCVF